MLEKLFREKKPNLSDESIRQYAHSVRRIIAHTGDEGLALAGGALDTYLESIDPVIARNLLTAVLVLKGEPYRPIFNKYVEAAEAVTGLQTMSSVQRRNWTSLKDVRGMINRLKQDVVTHHLLEKESVLTRKMFRLLTAYVAWSIHYEFPMRNDLPSVKLVFTTSEVNRAGNFLCAFHA